MKHQEKMSFEITNVADYINKDNYIIFRNGFNIKDGEIFFNIENKKKYDNLLKNYKLHTFRIKYNNYSRFFGVDDLKKEVKNNLLNYNISDINKQDKVVTQKIPLNTKIKTSSGYKNLNNYVLKINYNTIVKTAFDLPDNPIVEYQKENGNIIHYIKDSNTILLNNKDNEYINIKDAILKGLLTFQETFNIENTNFTFKNALVYNNTVVGSIENTNELLLNDSLIPAIRLHGSLIDIDIGLNGTLEQSEEVVYYPDLGKIIGQTSYNEYINGDCIYFKDNNTLILLTDTGKKIIDVNNVVFSYDVPERYVLGDLWFDMSMSCIRLYDGFNWKNMSRPSLETICKKIELDNKYLNPDNNYLEIYGYDSTEEFMTLEMTISNEITKDIQFPIEDNFIHSMFVNGDEIYDFKDAAYGVHLSTPLLKSDLVQMIITKGKEFDWITGNVLDENTISLSHPFEINNVRKLLINDIEYTVNNIQQNKILVKDLEEFKTNDIILNTCDRVVAKILVGNVYSKAYPDFLIPFTPHTNKVTLPVNMSENRFDQIMVSNNNKEVVMNPEVILFPDDLYAYYSINNPTELTFNRYLQESDNVVVQFVKHEPCSFNPESMFEGQNTIKDISDKLIIDAIVNFEDPKLQLNYILQKIEESIKDNEMVDEIYKDIIIGNISTDIKTEEEKLQDLIDSASKPSNPDISETITVTKPMPPNIDDPILARPSNTVVRPVISIVSKNPTKYNKYNLQFTENFMEKRNELKKYLFDLNSKFSSVVWELTKTRDALRSMIHYLCNTLCLKEILKTIMEGFSALVDGLSKIGDLMSMDVMGKIKSLTQSIKDAFNKTLEMFNNAVSDLVGLAKDKLMQAWNQAKAFVNAIIDDALASVKGFIDKINAIYSTITGLFNKFKKTNIGKEIGKFKANIFGAIGNALSKITEGMKKALEKIKDSLNGLWENLKGIWEKIKNFDFKSFAKSLTIDNIIDFICNKLLKGLLDMVNKALEILRYLQRRFQNLIYKAFADNYRSPFNDLNYLKTLSNFFRSHINICDILREIWGNPSGFSLASFIKRISNLDRIFQEWKYNKKIIKNMGQNFNPLKNGPSSNRGKITDLAGAGNAITNSILMMDEMAGINEKTIERIIANLKRAFCINFKTTTGSILDKQAMGRQIFDPKKFENLAKKIVPF